MTGERNLTNYSLQMQNKAFLLELLCKINRCKSVVCLYSNAAFDNIFYHFDLCS